MILEKVELTVEQQKLIIDILTEEINNLYQFLLERYGKVGD
jgi:hypothetical protein